LHGDATILVVDDDDDFRRTSAGYLRDLGYVLFEANNAETAAEPGLARKYRDLLVTDVLTPGVTSKMGSHCTWNRFC